MTRVKLLKASAGSGKTYQLAYEYIRIVVEQPHLYRHILAVTFTNKATEEMKSRILQEISDLANGNSGKYLPALMRDTVLSEEMIRMRASSARSKILHDYSRFAIMTIDKFFQRIIRSFIMELGIDLNFNLQLKSDGLLSSASDRLIDNISTNNELKEWILAFVEEKIEKNRRWSIKGDLTELGRQIFYEDFKRYSPLMPLREELKRVITEAQSKVRTIENSMIADAKQSLEVMVSHGLTISDFAYGKSGVAGYFNKVASRGEAEYAVRVSSALESVEGWHTKKSPKIAEIEGAHRELLPLLERITQTHDQNIVFINSVNLLSTNYRQFALLSDLSQKVEEICSTENIMPISETNSILNRLISGNDAPFIFEKSGENFSHFMIDEFQDTSRMQWENFVPLLHNALSQTQGHPVLLVGDVKQSIYRFRGGDWRILAEDVEREFREVEVVDLTTNYRSLSNIVTFNNDLIDAVIELDNDQLNSELVGAYEEKRVELSVRDNLYDLLKRTYKNHRQNSPTSHPEGYVTISLYDKELAPPVVARVEELQERGYALDEIAILVRNGREGVEMANMLLNHKSQHPESKYSYDVVTQEALTIGNSPVVNFIIATLRLSMSSQDMLSRGLYNRWLGREIGSELPTKELFFIMSLRLKPPVEALEAILNHYELNQRQQEIAYIQALSDQAINYSSSTISDIPLFVKWWEETGAKESINVPSKSAIAITTIHKAKGLEYKVVLIPYCNWSLVPRHTTLIWAKGAEQDVDLSNLGRVPLNYNKTKMQNSLFAQDFYTEQTLSHIDNINILYVALTRAKEELHIMMPEEETVTNRVSEPINKAIFESANLKVMQQLRESEHQAEWGGRELSFGEPYINAHDLGDKGESVVKGRKIPYRSYPIGDRLKLRLNTQRYIDDDPDIKLSPLNYGVLMHRVFEGVKNGAEIEPKIKYMVHSGAISEQESVALRGRLERAFEDARVRSWFSDDWQVVRNESEIITLGDASSRRPDRVMISGSRAVVVDYKFGMNRPPSHRSQVRLYMDLLRQMGYSDIEGYIWYVSLEDIELC